MKQYDSVLDAINDLQKRGFTYDFNLDKDIINPILIKDSHSPEDIKIVEVYRFEGESDSSESAVVYALESEKFHLKGFMVNAYGIYSDAHSSALIAKLQVEHHEIN